jgi:uncharacterized membrane protein
MAAVVGIVFLIVGFARLGDWRGIVSIVGGVLWLLIALQHLRKARSQEPPSQA